MPTRPLFLLCAALPLVGQPVLAQEPAEVYALRPGDKIEVTVFTAAGQKIDVVEGERILDRSGKVFLPFVGTVQVMGLDQDELRQLLVDRYSPYYSDPVVNVKVMLRVNVTGAVSTPGQLFLDPTATVLDAVASAGGMGPEIAVSNIQIPADQSAVRLVRDGETTILNLRADEIQPEVLAMRIRSGDWIHVPYRPRSRIRDELLFWGNLISFAASVVGLIVLTGR